MYLVLRFSTYTCSFCISDGSWRFRERCICAQAGTELERIRALLTLSGTSIGVVHISLLVVLVLGVVMGFMGKWWGHGWIWVSLGLLIAMYVYMGLAGSGFYGKVRKAVGQEYMQGSKMHQPDEPAAQEVIDALLNKANPALLAVVGYAAIILLTSADEVQTILKR